MLRMAHAALIDDRLQIDGFDMYTWSGSYGLPSDGFPKNVFMDGSYFTQIDESETVYTDPLPASAAQNMNLSGPMYLKSGYVNPAPTSLYPARKYEFDDGRVTWRRDGRPWSWEGVQIQSALNAFFVKKQNQMLLFLIIVVMAVYFYSKMK
jgi:hypothetical protein